MKEKTQKKPLVGLGDVFTKADRTYVVVTAQKESADTFEVVRRGDSSAKAMTETMEKMVKAGYRHQVKDASPLGETKAETKAPNGGGTATAKAAATAVAQTPAKAATALISDAIKAAGEALRKTPLPAQLVGTVGKGDEKIRVAASVIKSDDMKPDASGNMPEVIPTDLTMPIKPVRARTKATLRVTFANGRVGTLLKGRTGYAFVMHHETDAHAQGLFFQPDGSAAERSPYPVWPQEIEIITDEPKAAAPKAAAKVSTPTKAVAKPKATKKPKAKKSKK